MHWTGSFVLLQVLQKCFVMQGIPVFFFFVYLATGNNSTFSTNFQLKIYRHHPSSSTTLLLLSHLLFLLLLYSSPSSPLTSLQPPTRHCFCSPPPPSPLTHNNDSSEGVPRCRRLDPLAISYQLGQRSTRELVAEIVTSPEQIKDCQKMGSFPSGTTSRRSSKKRKGLGLSSPPGKRDSDFTSQVCVLVLIFTRFIKLASSSNAGDHLLGILPRWFCKQKTQTYLFFSAAGTRKSRNKNNNAAQLCYSLRQYNYSWYVIQIFQHGLYILLLDSLMTSHGNITCTYCLIPTAIVLWFQLPIPCALCARCDTIPHAGPIK